jgi:hypothetical protein
MRLILNLETIGQVESFFQLLADLQDGVLVAAVAGPDSYKVYFVIQNFFPHYFSFLFFLPILSPFARMFTTAPQISSKLSKASPIKQRT